MQFILSMQFSCSNNVQGVQVKNKCPIIMQCSDEKCLYFEKTQEGKTACNDGCYTSCFESPFKTKIDGTEHKGYYFCPHKLVLIACAICIPLVIVILVVMCCLKILCL
ncbi:Hypothetical_protein [Hexamita inflata]|uniref:Hypothetical_protein n=1 Tax=Hexamita inflata TaxID=28002 RepID=A0AA86PX66_9EUKA|nr:Hypothetical protein HINF_LOCUS33447 [Hexamita inflata]